MSDAAGLSSHDKCEDNWTKTKAYRLCRDFLSGAWRQISSTDMIFRTVTGGLTNRLFYCSLPEDVLPEASEPREALLRIYSGMYNSIVTESVVITIMSERKLGPRLYGVFPGGRLEEYIPARALTCSQLRDPDVSTGIARKFAQVHRLHMPVSKTSTWIFDKLKSWFESLQSSAFQDSISLLPAEKRVMAEKVLSYDLEHEISWLESFLTKIDSPLVFSHNDLQEGNILLPDGPQKVEDRMVFIDFEYCSYNYRGFDLGNHFCEWAYDNGAPVYPHFAILDQGYPTHEEQVKFARAYLSAFSQGSESEQTEDMVEKLIGEANAFTLASHMLWVIWAVSQGCTSSINFGFLEYSQVRLNDYYRSKEKLLRSSTQNGLPKI